MLHPGVKMFRNQPVADGPVGPDRTRHPVGTDGRHAVHDADRADGWWAGYLILAL